MEDPPERTFKTPFGDVPRGKAMDRLERPDDLGDAAAKDRLVKARVALEKESDTVEIYRLQGKIAALKEHLRINEVLREYIKKS